MLCKLHKNKANAFKKKYKQIINNYLYNVVEEKQPPRTGETGLGG